MEVVTGLEATNIAVYVPPDVGAVVKEKIILFKLLVVPTGKITLETFVAENHLINPPLLPVIMFPDV